MKVKKILYFLAALVLPGIFLFFLYNSNKVVNTLYFSHFVIFFAILAVLSFLAYIVFCKISKSSEGALLMLVASWLFFWFFSAIVDVINRVISFPFFSIIIIAVMMGLIGLLALLFRKYEKYLVKAGEIFSGLSIVILVLFLFNFGQAFYSDALLPLLRASSVEKPYELRTEFIIDESLPTPDIYWIHMDGMISFDSAVKYFNEPQHELKRELEIMGFILNESARIVAGRTRLALMALHYPDFYDSYYGSALMALQHTERRRRENTLREMFMLDNVDLQMDIAPQNELFHAFIARGYNQVTITSTVDSGIVPIDLIYQYITDYNFMRADDFDSERANNWKKLLDFKELLLQTTPLSIDAFRVRIDNFFDKRINEPWLKIPEHREIVDSYKRFSLNEEEMIYRTLYDSFDIPSPKLVFLVNELAHGGYTKLYKTGEYVNPSPDNPHNIDLLYMPQHNYAIEVMLNTLEMILIKNPDAVIIIQGDHGMHQHESHDYMREAGYTEEEIIELNFSAISAVRIPDVYGGLDEVLDPLNIARVLVNRYVGKNYELLAE